MTEKEAEELKPAFIEATRDYFKYADAWADATTKAVNMHNPRHRKWMNAEGKKEICIFSDVSDRQIEALVDGWLKRAKTNAKTAKRVRKAVSIQQDILTPTLILLPRFIKYAQVYADLGLDLTGGMKLALTSPEA